MKSKGTRIILSVILAIALCGCRSVAKIPEATDSTTQSTVSETTQITESAPTSTHKPTSTPSPTGTPTPTPTTIFSPTPVVVNLPRATFPDGRLFDSKYYAILPGEGGYFNVYNSFGTVVDSFFCDTGYNEDPTGLVTLDELSLYHRLNVDEVQLINLTDQGFTENYKLNPYEHGFYQYWYGEDKSAVVLYDESGKHVRTMTVKDDAERGYYSPNVVAYHDEILLRVLSFPNDDEGFSVEETRTTFYFLAKDGTIKETLNTGTVMDLVLFGRKYIGSVWGDDAIHDPSGNVIVEDVSFAVSEAAHGYPDSPWNFYVYDYYMKDGKVYDATFQLVKKDTLDRDGNMIFGVEYDVSGILCRALNDMEGDDYFGYKQELVATGYQRDQIGIKTKWGEYVLPKKSNMDFCGVNRYHCLFIDKADMIHVYSLATGELLTQFKDKEWAVLMAEEYFLRGNRYSGKEIYDKDGNCRYFSDTASARILPGENVLLERGPYIGIADLNGEWIIKTLKWEMTRDAAAPESEW